MRATRPGSVNPVRVPSACPWGVISPAVVQPITCPCRCTCIAAATASRSVREVQKNTVVSCAVGARSAAKARTVATGSPKRWLLARIWVSSNVISRRILRPVRTGKLRGSGRCRRGIGAVVSAWGAIASGLPRLRWRRAPAWRTGRRRARTRADRRRPRRRLRTTGCWCGRGWRRRAYRWRLR